MTGLRTEIVTDTSALDRLEGEWNELLAASAADTVFLTFEWLATWWRHFSAGHHLHVVTVRDGSRLVAIAPFMRSPRRLQPLRPFPTLEFLGCEHLSSDYLDVIVRRGAEAAVRDALVPLLTDAGLVLDLVQVSASGSALEFLVGGMASRGWQVTTVADAPSRLISIGGRTWDDYLATLGSSHRYNVRRRRRNLQKAFEVRIDTVTNEADRRPALDRLIELHNMRWHSRGDAGAFPTGALVAFHDEVSRRFLARGWLRLFLLSLNGTPAAAFYGFSYGGTWSFFQHGLDPQFHKHSVGQVLIGLSIEQAIGEGAAVYDLLSGYDTYKDLWARETRDLVKYRVCPPGVRQAVLALTDRALAARRALRDRFGRPAAGPAASPPEHVADQDRE